LRYSLFLGCTIPARVRHYEMSVRVVAATLGIDLVDVPEFACCGFPLKAIDHRASTVLSARNLCYAEQKGLDICVLCSACAAMLTEDALALKEKSALRDEVNQELSRIGRQYKGTVQVRHFIRILYEEVGLEKISHTLKVSLAGFRFAPHYGCHYLKPSDIYKGFDSVEHPRSLDALIQVTGAQSIDYLSKRQCCGGSVMAVDQETALALTREKLQELSSAGVDAMVLFCPFCSVMYDSNQKNVGKASETSYDLPVLFLPQLLGLAMGYEQKQLGLNMNVVKTRGLVERLRDLKDSQMT